MKESLKDAINENPLSLLLVFPATIFIFEFLSFLGYQNDKKEDPAKIARLNKNAD